jgi:hypothetical protein
MHLKGRKPLSAQGTEKDKERDAGKAVAPMGASGSLNFDPILVFKGFSPCTPGLRREGVFVHRPWYESIRA